MCEFYLKSDVDCVWRTMMIRSLNQSFSLGLLLLMRITCAVDLLLECNSPKQLTTGEKPHTPIEKYILASECRTLGFDSFFLKLNPIFSLCDAATSTKLNTRSKASKTERKKGVDYVIKFISCYFSQRRHKKSTTRSTSFPVAFL